MYSMCATHFYSAINISTHITTIIIIISYFHNFVWSQVRPTARISQLLTAKQQKDLEAKPDQKIRKDEDKTKEKESCDDKVLTHKRTKNCKEDARKDKIEKIEAKAKVKEDTASENKTKEELLKNTKDEGKYINFISNRL